jgi:membrane protein required for colicin V production
VVKTAFILSFFLWIANSFEFKVSEDWVRDSKSYAYIEPMAPVAVRFLDDYTPVISRAVTTIQELVKTTTDGLID